MTQSLTIDSNNDMVLNDRRNLSLSAGLTAVIELCKQAAQAQAGEMVFDLRRGVPAEGAVFGGSVNLLRYETALRRALLAVKDVTGVISLTVTQDGNTLRYSATIQTIYGQGAL